MNPLILRPLAILAKDLLVILSLILTAKTICSSKGRVQ